MRELNWVANVPMPVAAQCARLPLGAIIQLDGAQYAPALATGN